MSDWSSDIEGCGDAAEQSRKVPIASSKIPYRGVTPLASSVEPKSAGMTDCFRKKRRSVNAATIPPNAWKHR